MNKKQTPIDYLVEQLLKKSDVQYINGFDYLVEQANVMFQNQIQDAWDNGAEHWDAEMDGNDYYNETFGDSK